MTDNEKEQKTTIMSKIFVWLAKYIWPCLVISEFLMVVIILTDIVFDWLNWTAFGAIATWILAAGVVVAMYQFYDSSHNARIQANEARKSTQSQVSLELFREFHTLEFEESVRSIYQLNRFEFRELSRFEKNKIDSVIEKFDFLGVLIRFEIIGYKMVIESYASTPAFMIWYQLAYCSDYIKKKRDYEGFFAQNFEGLVRLTLEYFSMKGMTVWFEKIGDKRIELVHELLALNEDDKPKAYPKFKKIEHDLELYLKTKYRPTLWT
jgi:hypothetical protein